MEQTNPIVPSNPPYRPTVMTTDVVAKLVNAFAMGFSDTTACEIAHIDRSTFYRHMKSDESFATKVLDAKNFVKIVAANRVRRTIMDDAHRDNAKVAMWYLEHKEPEEFGSKPTVVVNNVNYKRPSWFHTPKTQEAEIINTKEIQK